MIFLELAFAGLVVAGLLFWYFKRRARERMVFNKPKANTSWCHGITQAELDWLEGDES